MCIRDRCINDLPCHIFPASIQSVAQARSLPHPNHHYQNRTLYHSTVDYIYNMRGWRQYQVHRLLDSLYTSSYKSSHHLETNHSTEPSHLSYPNKPLWNSFQYTSEPRLYSSHSSMQTRSPLKRHRIGLLHCVFSPYTCNKSHQRRIGPNLWLGRSHQWPSYRGTSSL